MNPDSLFGQSLGVIEKREDKILIFWGQPWKFEEIVDAGIVCGRANRPRAFYVLAERWVMGKYLEHLMEEFRMRQD